MLAALKRITTLGIIAISAALITTPGLAQRIDSLSGSSAWQDDLSPISATAWNYKRAAHLLERAGFAGTPEQIQILASMSPSQAVRRLVYYDGVDNSHLLPFEHSGIHDPGLEPFPPSRPATGVPTTTLRRTIRTAALVMTAGWRSSRPPTSSGAHCAP